MRNTKIKTFYTDKQVCFDSIREKSYSQSPLKPYLLINKIKSGDYADMIEIVDKFEPVSKQDFELAHSIEYVNNVFNQTGNYDSNGLPWSKNLVESLPYTTGSLYNASKFAIMNPDTVCFAPISGMHHAMPNSGSGFCTFSGQVISAIKIYQEFGKKCAYLDLDGHFGNSIEDTREFASLLNEVIPIGFNFNPRGRNETYVECFKKDLSKLSQAIIDGEIDYVVFAHGADSHDQDDLGGYMNTDCWVECAEVFSEWVNTISSQIGRSLPVVLALFGGYRKDDYDAVLDLHTKSLIRCSNIMCGNQFIDKLQISKKHDHNKAW